MKIEIATKQRIIRNAVLSLFIYILPLVLMFLTFYFTGERPWEKKQPKDLKESSKSIINKNNANNEGND